MPSIANQLNEGGPEQVADAAELALGAGDLSTAIQLFDQAEPGIADADRCAGGRWMAHMLAGNFAAAWREGDAIRRRGRPDPHRFWNGEDLRGKRLMLRSLHGFGDAVQMFRFLPKLRETVAELIVEVPPRLTELARCFAGVDEVITWGEDAPANPPAWDVQMEVMELPYVLRVSLENLGPRQGYFRLPQTAQERVAAVVGPRRWPRVGVVWGAGHWNPSRSIPLEVFKQLLEVGEVEFWSLQGDTERHAWAAMGREQQRRDVHECGDGILPLAALIARMDLVITVDTLAAHLAGALGVPCWVLLQRQADWRWMLHREDSPWYPTLRLIRQETQGDWASLILGVRSDLMRWVADQNEGRNTQSTHSALLA